MDVTREAINLVVAASTGELRDTELDVVTGGVWEDNGCCPPFILPNGRITMQQPFSENTWLGGGARHG